MNQIWIDLKEKSCAMLYFYIRKCLLSNYIRAIDFTNLISTKMKNEVKYLTLSKFFYYKNKENRYT